MTVPTFGYRRCIDLSRPLVPGGEQHPWFRYETRTESIVDAVDDLQLGESLLSALTPGTMAYNDQAKVVAKLREDYDVADFRLREIERMLLYMRELNRFYEFGIGL